MVPAGGGKGPSGSQILGEVLSLTLRTKQHNKRAAYTSGRHAGSGRLPTREEGVRG